MKKILLILLISSFANAHDKVCRVLTHASYIINSGESTYLVEAKDRRCLMIENKGVTTVLVKFGGASVASEGISIAAGTMWSPEIIPTNIIRMKSVGSSATVTVVDGK